METPGPASRPHLENSGDMGCVYPGLGCWLSLVQLFP